MKDKINKLFSTIIPIVLILISICLPLLNVYSSNGEFVFKTRLIFGFHYFIGMMVDKSQVLVSSPLSILFFILPLSIIIFTKNTKNDLGLKLVNFIISSITFIYFLLLPFNAYKLLNDNYSGLLDFKEAWGYYVIILLYFINLVYFSYDLIRFLIKVKKEIKEKEDIIIEDKYEAK